MNTIPFGKTDLRVARLGFGGAPVGYLETEQRKVKLILDELLDAGVNLIDTANCYPLSQQVIGEAIAGRRDQCVLVTKCGHQVDGLPGEPWSAQLITASVERSLKQLRTDYLDVMLLHSCEQRVLEKGDALRALEKARDAGKVRYLGYSGDNQAAAYAAGLEPIDVIEMSINIVDQANIDAVLPICKKRNLGVIAKRPIANAAWKKIETQPGLYREYAQTYTQRLAAMDVTPQDLGYHGHVDVEWPEIALRFTLSQEGVHVAIAGTTSQVNARANIAATEKEVLPEDVVQRLREAFAKASAGQRWLGQV